MVFPNDRMGVLPSQAFGPAAVAMANPFAENHEGTVKGLTVFTERDCQITAMMWAGIIDKESGAVGEISG